MSFILFIGGARSGKSGLARLWTESQAPCRLLVETLHVPDADRNARMKPDRKAPGQNWQRLDEPLEPLLALQSFLAKGYSGSVMLDSIGELVRNLMLQNVSGHDILRRIKNLAQFLANDAHPCAVVTEEGNMGQMPAEVVARKFGDIMGLANQLLARQAHAALLVVAGLPVLLKGALPEIFLSA